MKASFNGARRRLAWSFNNLVETEMTPTQWGHMATLRECIGALLCMYDDNIQGDCDDLSSTVTLKPIEDTTAQANEEARQINEDVQRDNGIQST